MSFTVDVHHHILPDVFCAGDLRTRRRPGLVRTLQMHTSDVATRGTR